VPLVVGVDSSTTSCKVQVRDADSGTLVGSGWAPHPLTAPPRSEQDPHTWEEAFSVASAMAGTHDIQPGAISIAAQQHGAVVIDDQGEVVRPAKLWNDTESAADARELLAALPGGAAAWAEACGSVPLASFTITKLRWLRRCEPESFRRMGAVLLPHDWLTFRLTGEMTTDRGEASGTGYWSPAEGRYRPDLLALVDERVDWETMLPSVLGPATVAGTWAGTKAIVGPGTGDNMAGALGLGLGPGDLCLSFGTSGVACTVADGPRADASGTVAGFADATGRFLPLVCTLNATKVTDSVSRLLGVTIEEFDALALSAPAGAGGLVLVPHFDGERTPDRPEARGTLAGIGNDVSPACLARAAVEGVVCNLLAGVDTLVGDAGTDGRRVFLVGGGARSAAYRQIAADLMGTPLIVPSESELVAAGAAVQAAVLSSSPPRWITSPSARPTHWPWTGSRPEDRSPAVDQSPAPGAVYPRSRCPASSAYAAKGKRSRPVVEITWRQT
jgi:xylulokinase